MELGFFPVVAGDGHQILPWTFGLWECFLKIRRNMILCQFSLYIPTHLVKPQRADLPWDLPPMRPHPKLADFWSVCSVDVGSHVVPLITAGIAFLASRDSTALPFLINNTVFKWSSSVMYQRAETGKFKASFLPLRNWAVLRDSLDADYWDIDMNPTETDHMTLVWLFFNSPVSTHVFLKDFFKFCYPWM